jgi:hypothetical protein
MGTKNFGKNLLVYEEWYKNRRARMEELGLFIKVTDYQKRNWAQTPLERDEVEALVGYLKEYLEQATSLEVE